MTQERPTGVVYDLGYKPHVGELLGRRAVFFAVLKDGLRRVMGLRRRARRKVLPWLLIIIAVIPSVVGVGISAFTADFQLELPGVFTTYGSFPQLATIALLFTAFAAPELVIPDREQGVMSIYASRPLTTQDYLLARAAALGVLVLTFLMLPQLVMYIGFAATSAEGFTTYLADHFGDMVRALVASIVYLATFGSAAFIVALFAKRVAPAASAFIAGMYGSIIVAEIITESGASTARWFSLLALPMHPQFVRDWIFDRSGDTIPDRAGFDPWISLLVILVLVAVTGASILRRYRKLA